MDSNERYKRLTSGLGGELRNLAHAMLVDPDLLPGRAELQARIAEIIPDDHEDLSPVRAAIEQKLTALARKAQGDRSERFTLRGVSDEWVLDTAAKLEGRDRLVPVPEPEVIDLDAVRADIAAHDDPMGTRKLMDDAFKTPEDRVRELEAEVRSLQEGS